VTPESNISSEQRKWPATAHEATRFMLGHLPHAEAVTTDPANVERIARADDPAVLIEPELMEGNSFSTIRVADPRRARGESGFAAFLDGTQEIRVVNQLDGIPIVWATVSAAVRARVNRRMVSWRTSAPIVAGRYYIPFRYVSDLDPLLRDDPRVVDTGKADSTGKFPSRHPAALMEAAVKKVQDDRERCEIELAEAWCASENAVLFADGSIMASKVVSASDRVVGVIKSHRRLYADGDAFRVLVRLESGCRTSIFRVAPRSRHAVASWYVRIRPAIGRDALFGLLRVEASLTDDISARADEISRWLLAEGAPLALPDGRWDKMAYGIRDAEEFLRAIS